MFRFLAVAVLLVASSALASSGIPWVGAIEYAFEEASIMLTPAGTGPGLDAAMAPGGVVVDATVRVQLVDIHWDVIWGFPREDIWLQFEVGDGTVGGCLSYGGPFSGGVFPADHNTDTGGWTEFALPLRGGGWSEGPAWVYLNGSPAQSPDGFLHDSIPLRANSPDINGDQQVNLSDIAFFTPDLYGAYHVRSDLWWDGVINLSDVVWFSQALGVACD